MAKMRNKVSRARSKPKMARPGEIWLILIILLILGLLLMFAWKIFIIFLGISFIDYLFFRAGKPSFHKHIREYAERRPPRRTVHRKEENGLKDSSERK